MVSVSIIKYKSVSYNSIISCLKSYILQEYLSRKVSMSQSHCKPFVLGGVATLSAWVLTLMLQLGLLGMIMMY